ncbi:MAG: hypothetical protein QXX30_03630 [Candidatus Aenigmatarchaeota archaeon]
MEPQHILHTLNSKIKSNDYINQKNIVKDFTNFIQLLQKGQIDITLDGSGDSLENISIELSNSDFQDFTHLDPHTLIFDSIIEAFIENEDIYFDGPGAKALIHIQFDNKNENLIDIQYNIIQFDDESIHQTIEFDDDNSEILHDLTETSFFIENIVTEIIESYNSLPENIDFQFYYDKAISEYVHDNIHLNFLNKNRNQIINGIKSFIDNVDYYKLSFCEDFTIDAYSHRNTVDIFITYRYVHHENENNLQISLTDLISKGAMKNNILDVLDVYQNHKKKLYPNHGKRTKFNKDIEIG